jgi:hypothetical protein
MQGLTLASFLHGYHRYARHCVTGKPLKYEEFTRQPVHVMRELCRVLELPFDRTFTEKWRGYDKITGAILGKARGSHLQQITPLPHHVISADLRRQLEGNKDYLASLELLGY